MPLTPAQIQAIAARGNVIVVAGAGTGKTSTLVERCVALLGEGCSVERILMVTFTEAAAAEMRHRLRVRLAAAAAQAAPERVDWWQEQLALLDTARICTLHSFCLQLVRENFHLLGIDPGVKILDERQTRPLIEAALDASFEPHFAGTDETAVQVRELIHRYGQGDVEHIRALVLKLHGYAQSLESPGRWYDLRRAEFAETEPGEWRGWLQSEVVTWARAWLPEVDRAAGTAENLARCARALGLLLAEPLTPALSPSDGEREKNHATRGALLLAEILAADAAEWPKKMKTKLRVPFGKFFEEAEFLASQFEAGGLNADWTNVRLPLRALLLLAREFAAQFAAAKRELGGVDFADLEQFALQLLWSDEAKLTAVAAEWRGRFEQVFVDECQDINAAQDAILRAVSGGKAESGKAETSNIEHRTSNLEPPSGAGQPTPDPTQEGNQRAGNRFLVGDVKQSIYQFRLARPALFRGYEREWAKGEAGQRILLAENFRSEPEIIGFVNELFKPLMRDEVGGVEYEALVAGRVDGEPEPAEAGTANEKRRVEFCLVPKGGEPDRTEATDGTDDPDVEDLLAVEREARLVAVRLRALREAGLEIWDKETKSRRRVEWRDMAVLLRSPRSRVEAFAQEFHKCGVPLQAARGGFLESTEISDLLSLLRLLDNPLQDIPLLAVLRSPLVALTLDELAEVRAASGAKRFWVAVKEFHRKETHGRDARATTGWKKVDWFLQRFAVWRELSRQVSLSQCLETALRDSHYEAVIAAGERGAERAANIRKFIATVRQYDPYQRQGLFRFLKFVDALEAAEQDIEPAPAQSQDAVRLMSIHQSKGLEFPVVVVACLGGMFNARDLSSDVLLDEEFGLCAKAVNAENGARHPTLAHWLSARRQRRQMLGEELRLLYVAMTRARDRLLLTATATKKEYEAWEAEGTRPFTNLEILKARSPLDWLMLWLPTVTRKEDWQLSPEPPEGGTPNVGGVGELLSWRICREQEVVTQAEKKLAGSETGVPIAVDAAELVKRRIRWIYPNAIAATVAAKTTVTALRRKATELADEEAKVWVFSKGTHGRDARATTGLGAAEVGTLHHRFLQRMSLAGACDAVDVQAQIGVLTGRGVFSPTEAAELDVAALAGFWRGAVGSEIRAQVDLVKRELPFTARFTPGELEKLTSQKVRPGLEDEFVVVQGVADLVVMRAEEIWLLDFKTDHLRAEELLEKVSAYRPQLQIYAAALGAIYGRPVTRRWLHFLAAGETVLV